jgi:CBS domain-containing protein
MKVHEIMTAHARCVGPDNTLVEAAGLMRELDVGALPVCEEDRLSGIVTDRDMVLRGTAQGVDPNTTAVRDVMSQGVVAVHADQEVEEAVRMMEERQIRRLPVINRGGRLVGIVSLGDIATSSNPAFSGMALREVSEPASPNARQRRLAAASEMQERPEMPEVPGARRGPARGGKGATTGGRSGGGRNRSATKAKTTRSARSSRSSRSTGGSSGRKSSRGGSRKTSTRSNGGNRRGSTRAAAR